MANLRRWVLPLCLVLSLAACPAYVGPWGAGEIYGPDYYPYHPSGYYPYFSAYPYY
jgi:hypothetical protein